MYIYFKKTAETDYISAWKSKDLSDESIKFRCTSDNGIASELSYTGVKTRVNLMEVA